MSSNLKPFMNEKETSNADCLQRLVRHPAFDADGYPTDETLNAIEEWPYTDFDGLLEYVREAWSDIGRIWEADGDIKLATGGWSGNESIIGAMQQNHVFWAMAWYSSTRGGLHILRMPNEKS